MEDNVAKAFDFANDLTKQLLTLATAVLTLSVGFIKDLVPATQRELSFWPLEVSWLLLFLSIFFGVLMMQALTGHLDPLYARKGKILEVEDPQSADPPVSATREEVPSLQTVDPTIQAPMVRLFCFLQWSCFVSGIGFFGFYGWHTINVMFLTRVGGMGAGGV